MRETLRTSKLAATPRARHVASALAALVLSLVLAGCATGGDGDGGDPGGEQPAPAIDADGNPVPANTTAGNATPAPPPIPLHDADRVALQGAAGWVELNLTAPLTLALTATPAEGQPAPVLVTLLRDAREPSCGALPAGWFLHTTRVGPAPAWSVPAGDWQLYVALSGPGTAEVHAGDTSGRDAPNALVPLRPADAARPVTPYVAHDATGMGFEEPLGPGFVVGRFDPGALAYGPTSVTTAAVQDNAGHTCLAAENRGQGSPLYGGVDVAAALPDGGTWVARHDGVRAGAARVLADWIPLGWGTGSSDAGAPAAPGGGA